MKIDFLLMNYKGFYVLSKIIDNGYRDIINSVISAKDINVVNDYYNDIEQICKNYSIRFFDRKNMPQNIVDYKIAIGWRWIIEDYKNLIIIHDSLLPKYRGFAPLASALINGETSVGATLLLANKEYDKGDIIIQKELVIHYPVKLVRVIEEISKIYVWLIIEFLKKLQSNSILKGQPQNDEMASYSLWRDEEDYRIDWNKNSGEIHRFIDSVGFPYKGASCLYEGNLIRIHECVEINDVSIVNRISGKIFLLTNGHPIVVCGKGLLMITHATNDIGENLEIKSLRTRFQ